MPTDTTTPPSTRTRCGFQVDVLDFSPLRAEAIREYIKLKPEERGKWDDEKLNRLVITTECRWGRIIEPAAEPQAPDSVFMLNEKGEGPKRPLTEKLTVSIQLFAQMKPSKTEAGWMETVPFISVQINDVGAKNLPSIGKVGLEQFIKDKLPEYEEAYQSWQQTLRAFKERVAHAKARRHGRLVEPELPAQDAPRQEEKAPQPSEGGAMQPPKPPTRRGISM